MVNITNHYQNVSNLQDLLAVTNTQTGGWFYFGVTLMIFVVLSINFLGFGFETALITSAFITLVLGLFLVYMSLMSWSWLMFYLGIILIIIFYKAWTSKEQ